MLTWLLALTAAAAEPPVAPPPAVAIRTVLGRPTVFVAGTPMALAAYNPPGFGGPNFAHAAPSFLAQPANVWLIEPGYGRGDYFGGAAWDDPPAASAPGAVAAPPPPIRSTLDDEVRVIQARQPQMAFIIRFGIHEDAAWRQRHADQLVVNEEGTVLPTPSLASTQYWDAAARYSTALIRYCQAQPWGERVIGFANFQRVEGTHEPLIDGWLYDCSPVMTARWRQFLRAKYGTDAALQAAYGDPALTLATVTVPHDRLRGPVPQVQQLLYWQNARDNQPLRDYLELTRDLYHAGFAQVQAAMTAALTRPAFIVHDALKQTMLGWSNGGFFTMAQSWPWAYPELMAGSGHLQVASLFDLPGMDGLITPHDYQARGVGGVFEPEGSVDSTVLRGKLFLCEMDQRSYRGESSYGSARDLAAFTALTWRNLATALTRGFTAYWMDLHQDWFSSPEMQPVITRQLEVARAATTLPHVDVPGIAMILDDQAILETNGNGAVMNEHVMWELKSGLSHCGVPFRVYLLEDLALANFPPHQVFYFPNLYRVDEARLKLLRDKVLRAGHVVVWGPGSGISDGRTIAAAHATQLTGFAFDWLPLNLPRRTLLTDPSHLLTAGLSAGEVLSGPLSYGPVLFPRDGQALGAAWTKQGLPYTGLAVKRFGRGARSELLAGAAPGPDDYAGVFTTTAPLPPEFWRGAARFAGTHVYSETNDVILADRHLVALHTVASGPKLLALPQKSRVWDLITGEYLGAHFTAISFAATAPSTRLFRLEPEE